MFGSQPNCIAQISDIYKYKNLSAAIHTFNSLVLDDQTRWYAKHQQFQQNMETVKTKPMDFDTIRQNILSGNKYKEEMQLFEDIQLVLNNAMEYNTKGDIWYDDAYRLSQILKCLKEKKVIKQAQWIPAVEYNDIIKTCPKCNNIMIPSNLYPSKRCNECSTNIIKQETKCYVCFNHSDGSHSFCQKCVKTFCTKCCIWHIGQVGQNCDVKRKIFDSDFNERLGYGLGTKEWLKVHGNTSSGAKLYKWVYDKLIVLGVISGLPLSDRDRHKGDWMPQMPHLIPSENIKKFNCVLSECIDAKWYLIKKCRRKQIAALQPSLLLYLETIHFLYPSLVGIDMDTFKMWLSGEIDANDLYNKCRVDMDRVAEEIYDANNNDDDSD